MFDYNRLWHVLSVYLVLPVLAICQFQSTDIDLEGPVYSVLPTIEGPVYYIQKNNDVIYGDLKSFAKLKVYDGYNLIDLAPLGRWVDANEQVNMDHLLDGSIFISFSYFNLEYLYDPLKNKLETFTSPLSSGTIYGIGVVEGHFYYSIRIGNKYQIIRYNAGIHEVVCDSENYISQIIKGDDSYLFLNATLNAAKNSFTGTNWQEMDLNCNPIAQIKGLSHLGFSSKNNDLKITELIKDDEKYTYCYGGDSSILYEWNKRTNSILKLPNDNSKSYLQRCMDTSGNIIELYNQKGEMKFDFTSAAGKKDTHETNYTSSQVRELKIGISPEQLWLASKEGLHRVDLDNPSVTRLLVDDSFRNINVVNNDELLICTALGTVFIKDRNSPNLREATKIGKRASNNRLLARDQKGRLLLDGSWNIYALNDDYNVDTVAYQGNNYYVQLLDNDDLFMSSAYVGNFITPMSIDAQDTLFLSKEIDKVLDCTNLDENTIAMASNKGFSIYDIKQEKFIFQDTSKKKALSLLRYDSSHIYVGYEDGILRQYDKSNQNFEQVGEWPINPSYGIAKILPTTENRIWISTFKGVCVFDVLSTEYYFLDNSLFINPECNRYSSFYDSIHNQVYIGTVAGLYIFNENIGRDSTSSIDLFFVEKSYPLIENDSIVTDYILCDKSTEITLPAKKRNFTLRYSTQTSPYGTDATYHHRLNEGQWIENGSNNQLTLNYLQSGKNRIEIKAINNKSESNIILATVHVQPFFYESWWFRLSAIVLILLVSLYWLRRLTSQNKRLEAAVKARTSELQAEREVIKKQAEELENLDKLKNQFFANISHELRTPLTLLISPIEGISEGKNLTLQQKSLLRIMKDNGELLQSRISELLELSRLTSKKVLLRSHNIQLDQLIHSSTRIFEPIASKKDLELIINGENLEVNIIGDEIRMSKIIQNLLINAIKFTNKGGVVTCNFTVHNHELLIEISDTGIGIEEKNIDKIFHRFYQVQSVNELANPGTGIGLSMVKEYIELMKGSIAVSSEYERGTKFSVTLPLEFTNEIKTTATLKDTTTFLMPIPILGSDQKPKLLIVEDNQDLRKYITLVLQKYYTIVDAEDGEIAWNLLQEDPTIDIILSDIMMPNMNGVTLLNMVRQNASIRIKPFVFLTAKHNEHDLASAYRMGVDDYLKKPFSEKELIYRLNAVYKNYKARLEYKDDRKELAIEQSNPTIEVSDFITKLNKTILENIESNEFSLDLLAEKLKTSKRTLIRMVKKEVGLTPNKYIVEVKLNKARQLYEAGTCDNLEEVITQVGFSTAWYFRKLYIERFGAEWGQ